MIRVLDVLTAVLTIVCLNLAYKSYKVWILYTISSIMFTIVMLCKNLPGMSIMGVFLIGTGIHNYFEGKKHAARYSKH